MMDWTARDLTSQWPLRLCRGSCVEQRRSRENQVQPLDEGGDRTAPHRQTEEPRATRARVLLHRHNHRLAMVARWFVFYNATWNLEITKINRHFLMHRYVYIQVYNFYFKKQHSKNNKNCLEQELWVELLPLLWITAKISKFISFNKNFKLTSKILWKFGRLFLMTEFQKSLSIIGNNALMISWICRMSQKRCGTATYGQHLLLEKRVIST